MKSTYQNRKQWRFEAIDLRAGMAVAIWREQRNTAHGLPPEQATALFFSPPYFQPEPLVNITIALSACRGTFDSGLYLDSEGAEASFETPDAVGEFLRRAYINGAAGDGTDGGEPGPMPPPEDDGGNPDLPLKLDSPLIDKLTDSIIRFTETANRTPLGESKIFSWGEKSITHSAANRGNSQASPADTGALIYSTLQIIEEMFYRMPQWGTADWLEWYDDIRRFASILIHAGIAEALLEESNSLTLLSAIVQKAFNESGVSPSYDEKFFGWLILFGPRFPNLASKEDFTELSHYLHDFAFYWERFGPSVVRPAEDPLDILFRIPLPRALRRMFPNDMKDIGAVYHLLNLVVSEPAAAYHFAESDKSAICLALFAATCVASSRLYVYHSPVLFSRFRDNRSERARMAIELGYAWLIEHLPRQVYAATYETLIAKSKTVRYTSPLSPTPL